MTNTIGILNYPELAQQTLVAFLAIVITLTVVIALADAISDVRERRSFDRQRSIARRIGDVGPCALCGERRVLDGHTVGTHAVCATCAGLTHTERVA